MQVKRSLRFRPMCIGIYRVCLKLLSCATFTGYNIVLYFPEVYLPAVSLYLFLVTMLAFPADVFRHLSCVFKAFVLRDIYRLYRVVVSRCILPAVSLYLFLVRLSVTFFVSFPVCLSRYDIYRLRYNFYRLRLRVRIV